MTTPQTKQRELTAGRELDAKIATLMGYRAFKETRGEYTLSIWRKPGEREPWEDFRNPVVERSRFAEVTCEGALEIGFFGQGFPRFSTDIAAAWEVVEKCGLSVVHSEDGWYAIKPEDIVWGCVRGTDFPKVSLVGAEHEHDQFSIAYDTAPEAICRAALQAVQS